MGNSSPNDFEKDVFSETELKYLEKQYRKSFSQFKNKESKESKETVKLDSLVFNFKEFKSFLFADQENKIESLLIELNLVIPEKEANFDHYLSVVHLLTKSSSDKSSKKTEFYHNSHTFNILYDCFTGKKGSYEKLEEEVTRKVMIWAYESYLTFSVQRNNDLLPKDIKKESEFIENIPFKFDSVSTLLNKYYNLESFLSNSIKFNLIVRANHNTDIGIPILYEKLKSISYSQYFLFCLMNPHINSKKYAYKLFDCLESGFSLTNIIYSFLGFEGPVALLVHHFDKETAAEPVLGYYINSNIKECYEKYCGDDLSFIFSIENKKISIYNNVSSNNDKYVLINSKNNRYSNTKAGIGMGDFYDDCRIWIDKDDLFGASHFYNFDNVYEEGSPFENCDKKILNVSNLNNTFAYYYM